MNSITPRFKSEVLEALEDPDAIYEGGSGELLAAKKIHADKYLVVVFKEISEKDGFEITAFLSSRRRQQERRAKGAFPNDASLLRLGVAILMDIKEEWLTGREYLSMDKE